MCTPDHGTCRRLAADSVAWPTMRDHLVWRLPALTPQRIDEMIAEGRFVTSDGTPIDAHTPFRAQTFVFFHRDLPDETPVPHPIGILGLDERILVVDKPHFLSSIPRGRHVVESVVVRLRTQLGMPELTVAHRLDRVTAGVLLLTRSRQWRRPYQELFERRQVTKTYRAIARHVDLTAVDAPGVRHLPDEPDGPWVEVTSRIVKERGVLQAREVEGPVNARTRVRVLARRGDLALYEARPLTGRTHQVRLHLQRLGAPILDDPFYPRLLDVDIADFSAPLQLQAHPLAFTDPVDGTRRSFTSRLPLARW